ncbi:dihydrofolate reductase family protein [Rhodococcus fascians]|nr:dihydrofolate reductase family protein [Rhodococcus fascians]
MAYAEVALEAGNRVVLTAQDRPQRWLILGNSGYSAVIDALEKNLGDIRSAETDTRAQEHLLVPGESRVTFEGMRDYWGPKTDDTTGVTDHLNNVAKYVVSSTLKDPGWANSTVLSGPLTEEVRQIKQMNGSDIVCTGSITLCRSLIAADLVDEYRLFQYPFARGHGERLFDRTPSQHLQTLECQVFLSGATLMRYSVRRWGLVYRRRSAFVPGNVGRFGCVPWTRPVIGGRKIGG